MNSRERLLYEAKADILKALAHPTRLWIAESLASGERCVCEINQDLELDPSTVSKHLAILKQAGIVEDDKRGKQVYYRLKVPCVLNFMHCVEAVIEARLKSQLELVQ